MKSFRGYLMRRLAASVPVFVILAFCLGCAGSTAKALLLTFLKSWGTSLSTRSWNTRKAIDTPPRASQGPISSLPGRVTTGDLSFLRTTWPITSAR